MTDQPPCTKCGQHHPKCTAHTRAGNPCRQQPMTGQTVCRMHGGSAPQSVAAAHERVVNEKAEETIAQLWPGLAQQAPIKDPVDLLARTAAALEQMTETVGTRINQNSTAIAAGKDMTQLRAEVVLLDRLLDKLLKASEGMARLGIAERQVRIEEEQAAIVTTAFRAAIAVVQLLPADRDLVVRTFLEKLGQATVAGEVA
jgi:hypothetical protein